MGKVRRTLGDGNGDFRRPNGDFPRPNGDFGRHHVPGVFWVRAVEKLDVVDWQSSFLRSESCLRIFVECETPEIP